MKKLLKSFILAVVFSIILVPAAYAKSDVLWQWRQEETINHGSFIHPTNNGTLFIVKNGYLDPKVIEVDKNGKTIWESDIVQANSIHPLNNGRFLLTAVGIKGKYSFKPSVVEMNKEGKIFWEYKLPGRAFIPRYAERLSNGNTLITTPFKIIEVNSSGETVWEYSEGLKNASQAVRLKNGNTLITDKGIVLGGYVKEISPDKKVIWDSRQINTLDLKKPIRAEVLNNNLIRITDLGLQSVLDIDKKGTVVNEINWEETAKANWIGNQWYCYPVNEEEVILSASYTNGKSTVMHIKPSAL